LLQNGELNIMLFSNHEMQGLWQESHANPRMIGCGDEMTRKEMSSLWQPMVIESGIVLKRMGPVDGDEPSARWR
jgi:hypothetical protein